MDLSIFLAKVLGLYMLLIGSIWMVRKKQFAMHLKELFDSKALVVFSGCISLVVGLAMAISHSHWQMNWIGLITLIGYIALVKGIVRCAYPEKTRKIAHTLIQKSSSWLWLIFIVLGGYLTYSGFSA